MSVNDYHFITNWRVKGTIEDVADILSDATDLVRWWPAVYLNVEELESGDEAGIGRLFNLYTTGWLPYTLLWQMRVLELDLPQHMKIEALGDFVGRGIWTLQQDGEWANIGYDWKIQATKPLLRTLSFLIKPIFAANHQWAMAKGEESLKIELRRRQAKTEAERSLIPDPPGATFRSFVR